MYVHYQRTSHSIVTFLNAQLLFHSWYQFAFACIVRLIEKIVASRGSRNEKKITNDVNRKNNIFAYVKWGKRYLLKGVIYICATRLFTYASVCYLYLLFFVRNFCNVLYLLLYTKNIRITVLIMIRESNFVMKLAFTSSYRIKLEISYYCQIHLSTCLIKYVII